MGRSGLSDVPAAAAVRWGGELGIESMFLIACFAYMPGEYWGQVRVNGREIGGPPLGCGETAFGESGRGKGLCVHFGWPLLPSILPESKA